MSLLLADEREAVFDLHIPETGGGGYEVVFLEPKLDTVEVDQVVARLNETREIGTLLKGMRSLFAEEFR